MDQIAPQAAPVAGYRLTALSKGLTGKFASEVWISGFPDEEEAVKAVARWGRKPGKQPEPLTEAEMTLLGVLCGEARRIS